MARFYGSVQGQAGEATRLGSKNSGIRVYAQGWGSRVSAYFGTKYGDDELDVASISISGGGSSGAGSHILANDVNLDAIVNALDTRDERMMKLIGRVQSAFKMMEAEAPKAIRRNERKVTAERKRIEQEHRLQQALRDELRAMDTDDNDKGIRLLRKLCSVDPLDSTHDELLSRVKLTHWGNGDIVTAEPVLDREDYEIYNYNFTTGEKFHAAATA